MKTINIYLTRTEKKDADKIRAKYKVSLSTLVGTISYALFEILHKNGQEETLQRLMNNYLEKEQNANYKTSVKPREINEVLGNEIKKKNIFASNSLKIYLHKTINLYVDRDACNKYWARIDKELNEKYDIYWDYNCTIRSQRRSLRQNKEYWKKALENS